MAQNTASQSCLTNFQNAIEEDSINYHRIETTFKELKKEAEKVKNQPRFEHFKSVKKMSLRSAVIAMVALWETFICDVFEDGITILVKKLKELPYQEIIGHDKRRKLLTKALEEYKPTEDQLKQMEDTDYWKFALEQYAEKERKPICPYFEHIDKNFKNLFITEEVFSEHVAEKKGECDCILYLEQGEENPDTPPKLYLTRNALKEITRLYYGARCILSHGRPDQTLNKKGALYNFSTGENLKRMLEFVVSDTTDETQPIDATDTTEQSDLNGKAIREFYYLYKEVKDQGRSASLSYAHIGTMKRFFWALSTLVHNTFRDLIEQHYEVIIWEEHK